MRWQGRLLDLVYLDQDPRHHLAVYGTQLDDGRDEVGDVDEDVPEPNLASLQVQPIDLDRGWLIVRGSRRHHPATRGFQVVRAQGDDRQTQIRFEAPIGELDLGAPVLAAYEPAFGGDPGSLPAVIGTVVEPPAAGLARLVRVEAINRLLTDIAHVRSDPVATRGYLGVAASTGAEDIFENPDSPPRQGAVVTSVVEGSPADSAGLRAGDVIRAVDGVAIDSSTALLAALFEHAPGETARLTVASRGDPSPRELSVVLGAQP